MNGVADLNVKAATVLAAVPTVGWLDTRAIAESAGTRPPDTGSILAGLYARREVERRENLSHPGQWLWRRIMFTPPARNEDAMTALNTPTDGLAAKLAERATRERAEADAQSLTGFVVVPARAGMLGIDVTLTTAGTLGMGAEAHHLLGSPAKVQVLYHRERRMVALRAAAPGARDAVAVNPNGRGFAMSARTLVAMARVPKRLLRFTPQRVGDALVFGPLPEVAE